MHVKRVIKYFAGYTIPLATGLSIYFGGIWSFITPVYAFILLPFLELLISANNKNLSDVEEELVKKDKVYDWILYLHVPIQYAMLYYLL